MKNTFAGLVFAAFLITGCVKNNSTTCNYAASGLVAPINEIDSLHTILADSGLVATQNASGFSYTIDSAGTGAKIPNLCSIVTVSYIGSIIGGKVFDSTATGQLTSFQLGQLIVGWQKGLPLINAGGGITLYIPPTLGYGANPVTDNYGNVLIPANSYLIFHIYLAGVQ